MKPLILFLLFCFSAFLVIGQSNSDESARIRLQMAKIRQTTDWNDPVAAKKANAEIQKLAQQLSGSKLLPFNLTDPHAGQGDSVKSETFVLKGVASKGNVLAIAERFFKRSYKTLDGPSKFRFDQDFAAAKKEAFGFEAVRKLTSVGAVYITFGNDHNLACVYLAAAVKAFPSDTLSINNFGGYLRVIDSIEISIPVLLYANKLFSESPVILTQLGNSYYDLNDLVQAESYYKQALKYNPDFAQAHTALCDLYIRQKRLDEALKELFTGVKGIGFSYQRASQSYSEIKSSNESSGKGMGDSGIPEDLAPLLAPDGPSVAPQDAWRVKMPPFPDCKNAEDWLEGGGYSNAVMAFSRFHAEDMAFAGRYYKVHTLQPSIPPDATLRDYGKERFMIESIDEFFASQSNNQLKKYRKSMDELTGRVSNAKEIYLRKFKEYSENYSACLESCGGSQHCAEECKRQYCSQECPNANLYNDILKQAYNAYRSEFSELVRKQKRILDDLYGFTGPWIDQIYGQYWSTIYQYEIKSTALRIVGNCYASYPQAFQLPAHNDCGTDCSLFAKPVPEETSEVNKKDPEANKCPSFAKFKVPIAVCDISVDCESLEVGCQAIAAGSIKRNFKHKNTTFFGGVGVKGELGVVGIGAKAGFTVTMDDNYQVQDVGAKVDLNVNAGIGPAKIGITGTGSYTVMEGAGTKVSVQGGNTK